MSKENSSNKQDFFLQLPMNEEEKTTEIAQEPVAAGYWHPKVKVVSVDPETKKQEETAGGQRITVEKIRVISQAVKPENKAESPTSAPVSPDTKLTADNVDIMHKLQKLKEEQSQKQSIN